MSINHKAAALAHTPTSHLGEGTLWDPRLKRLYWIDIVAGLIHWTDRDRVVQSRNVGKMIGCIGLTANPAVLVAGLEDGVAEIQIDSGTTRYLSKPASLDEKHRFNDGKIGPDGRFWAGSMPKGTLTPTGSFYIIAPDGATQQAFGGVRCSNGLAWNLAKRLFYYIDTPNSTVDAFDYDPTTGAITNRRPVIDMREEGLWPDGMCIDAEGQLWVALWNGGGVARHDPDTGKRTAFVEVPASHITCCCFGGESLDTLFISTAAGGKPDPEFPDSGRVFAVKPGVLGTAPSLFGETGIAPLT